jgi:CheY-like chemotaxis protein/predicted Ser/Thr protein kinase
MEIPESELPDAATVAQLAQKVGLLTAEQLQEGWDEIGQQTGPAEPLLQALERKGYLTPLQSQKLLRGDTSGYFLGGYRLLYRIAAGSFGRVYRGDDPRSGRVVAIKVLRHKWSTDKKGIELFEREGKVGLGLRHPNIVEVLDVNHDPLSGQYYIVMEFVEGGNLREILRIRKKLGTAETLRILEDAASGLAYAYSRGITHRDMKLTNILISSQGVAKLVDFGLAGMEEMVHKEGGGQVDRTVDYAGLERATGVPPGDTRSDIYFLGCVAYELLTGRPPLEPTRDRRQRMLKERFTNIKPMTPDEVQGPPSLFRLVENMMSLDPRRRFQTPAQLLDAVREVRREVEPTEGKGRGPRALFIMERDERLQDLMRDKFKGLGYRVLLAADPSRALDRFRQQPYSALIADVRTVGEDGLRIGEYVLDEAERTGTPCAGVFILAEDQHRLAARIKQRPTSAALLDHKGPPGRVTIKQLHHTLRELLTKALGEDPEAPGNGEEARPQTKEKRKTHRRAN